MADATTTTDLPPRHDAAAVQAEVAAVWEAERSFHAEPDSSKEPFCVVIPPPNVTAALHLGHAFNNTIQDVLVRRARMQGKNAVWIPGTDHAGIATQTVVEKRLQRSEGKRRTDYGRDEFVAKVQAWKDEYESVILDQLRAMGCSCDFERTAFTMDAPRARAVREAFFRLFKDGLIYRGKRLVNWDPVTQTALADDEVENEEVDGHFYYIKYPLERRGTGFQPVSGQGPDDRQDACPTFDGSDLAYVTVATTRPETMLGDTAVAVNPNDPRAASLRGLSVRLPIVDRVVPIVEDDYVVMADPEGDDPKAKYATGFLKVTPAHDPNDWDIGQRHGLEVVNVMAPDASISDAHGWTPETEEAKQFVGLSREQAREKVVQWFKENGLLEEVRPYRHSVGHSYRSHVPVEPYLSDQWYVAVQKPIPWMPDAGPVEGTDVPANSLAGLALTALDERGTGFQPVSEQNSDDRLEACPTSFGAGPAFGDNALTFVPDRYAKTYRQWNAALRDWCISRQLWWGHRIPAWEAQAEGWIGGQRDGHYFEDVAASDKAMLAAVSHVERTSGLRAAVRHSAVNDETQELSFQDELQAASWDSDRIPERLQAAFANTVDAESQQTLVEAGLQQDPDVLDTWFSSALWPMSTLGWPVRTPELQQWNPTSVLCTAREIITLWVSRMVMFNRYMLAHPDERAVASAGRADDSLGHAPESPERTPESTRRTSESPGLTPESPGLTPGSAGRTSTSPGLTPTSPGQTSGSPVDGFGPVPFRAVFIHAMIQDGHGQKMSKSLGNGVDPRDIIASHGADAMRFTLAGMATHTQDVRLPVDLVDPHTGETFAPQTFVNKSGHTVFKPVQDHLGRKCVSSYGLASGEATPGDDLPVARNTSAKFDLGRNFCNKLWNAGRFVISNLKSQTSDGLPASAGSMTTIDAWILSRLSEALRTSDEALDEYRFDRYVTAAYDFFWRDFCDWYVEAAKPVLKTGGPAAATTRRVLATCLDASLRLLHPAIPFVTERLWWALNDATHDKTTEATPLRGVPNLIDLPPSDRCITASWPTSTFRDEPAESAVSDVQAIVEAVRRVRAENKVPPRKTVPVVADVPADLRPAFELWANADLVESVENAAETTAAGIEIKVGGVVDLAADAGRVAKERADLEKQVKALRGRLANKGYTDKAPPHLVQETRDQLAAAEAELAKL